jgi:hypothetical protein
MQRERLLRASLRVLAAVALELAACGSTQTTPPPPDADAGQPGWSACTSPDGAGICLGTANCPPGDGCWCISPPETSVSVCLASPGMKDIKLCYLPPDGRICTTIDPRYPDVWWDAPWGLGVLLAQNSAQDRARYADWARWTGAPLPNPPSSCPKDIRFRACGGACGACVEGERCTGRSPLHPIGMCVRYGTAECGRPRDPSCPAGTACFRYRVDAESQALANERGLCLADCDGIAATLPGGGTCLPWVNDPDAGTR